ncbi:MAG TPA: DUF92 domain-containing protein, partial [Anaerolineae bacterium]
YSLGRGCRGATGCLGSPTEPFSITRVEKMPNQLIVAFLLSAVIVALALWRGSLSQSGAVGALFVGTLILGVGGWTWGILLGIFFVSSTLLSHYKEKEKEGAAEKFEKGHRRDIAQVMANGGLGATVALLSAVVPSSLWFPLFMGSMATVTADTWATELGTLSRQPPRLITTGRPVEAGTSGGVSRLGTGVSLLGGLLIGLAAGLLVDRLTVVEAAIIGTASGLIGSLFDSLLGATLQQVYYCDVCQKETERKIHRNGHQTRPLRGWSWLKNDLVNFIASFVGGATAVGLYRLLTSG